MSPAAVNLVFEVTPKFRVLSIHFEGAKAYKDRRLIKEIKTTANGSLDKRQVKDDAQKIYEFYQKSGYNQAHVTYTIHRNPTPRFRTVTFQTRHHPRATLPTPHLTTTSHLT